MIKQEGVEVTRRFYQAVDFLIRNRDLRGRQTFCRRYGIDKRNFYLIEKHPEVYSLKVAWIVYLVRDFNISAKWLLTGSDSRDRIPEGVNNLQIGKEQNH